MSSSEEDIKRQSLINCIGEIMSDISERGYCAGWVMGTEEGVPKLCKEIVETNSERPFGFDYITVEEATALNYLAKRLGSWVDFSEEEDGFVQYTPECLSEDKE